MAIKIIPDGDADLEAAIAACEALWAAGAPSVTIERPAPIIEVAIIAKTCGAACDARCRECQIMQLEKLHEEQEKALNETTARLREAVLHAHN